MTTDELQKLASLVRWIGWGIVLVGACVSFFSHFIADMIVTNGRVDKVKTEKRFTDTAEVLAETKAKTLTHDDILSYRTVTSDQRKAFIEATKDLPKGRLFVIAVQGDTESYKYAEAITEMLFAAGYEPTEKPATVLPLSEPITRMTAGIESEENMPAFAEPLILALQGAGFPVQPIIVRGAASRGPEYVHISIGSKRR